MRSGRNGWRNSMRSGRDADWLLWFLRGIGIIMTLMLILLFYVYAANAHNQWANGSTVPDWIKKACCGQAEAHILGSNDYWIDRNGFHIKAIEAVVPLDKVLPSQDGKVWAFYRDDVGRNAYVQCVFYSGAI